MKNKSELKNIFATVFVTGILLLTSISVFAGADDPHIDTKMKSVMSSVETKMGERKEITQDKPYSPMDFAREDSFKTKVETGAEGVIQEDLIPGEDYVPGCILIKFKQGVDVSDSSKALAAVRSITDSDSSFACVTDAEPLLSGSTRNMEQKREFGLDHWVKVTVKSNVDLLQEVKKYQNNPTIEYAELNYINHACDSYYPPPNDPYFNDQWALNNIGQTGGYFDADINALEAWAVARSYASPLEESIIAVIDSGVDYYHPDLMDNIWINNLEDINDNGQFDYYPEDQGGDLDGVDNDDNGFVDDVVGWDFVNLPPDQQGDCHPGEDGIGEDNDPMDFDGHGTNLAGVVAAVTNNNTGIAGVSDNYCKIMILRSGYRNVSGGGSNLVEFIIKAIDYAVDNGADVICITSGNHVDSQAYHDKLDYAYNQGLILIASAGNDHDDAQYYPAAYDSVIAVAATDNRDRRAGFSNFGNWVDVCAPGVDIRVTVLGGTDYPLASGTSYAAPHVAGLAGLLCVRFPDWSNSQIKERILSTAHNIDDANPDFEGLLGSGRIDAFDAMNQPPNEPTYPEPYSCESDVDINHILSWDTAGGDSDGDPCKYTIYFGTSPNPINIIGTRWSWFPVDEKIYFDPTPGPLQVDTTYYWRVSVEDEYRIIYSECWCFTTSSEYNNPPNGPNPSYPPPGEEDVDVTGGCMLSWSGGDPDPDDDVTYDVLLDTYENPGMLIAQDVTAEYDDNVMYDIMLGGNRQYYWRIVAKDDHGAQSMSDIFNFTTAYAPNQAPNPASNPYPDDGKTNTGVYTTLNWDGYDVDGDDLTYDVYFGTDPENPDEWELVSEGQHSTSYYLEDLDSETTYYWKVIVHDNQSHTTDTGPTWRFTTEKLGDCVINQNTGVVFQSIQSAIDDTSTAEGDTVVIHNGTYYERFHVNKSISLIGEDAETTVLDGGRSGGTLVDIEADNVRISGLTIRNSRYNSRGVVVRSDDNIIDGNTITNTYRGIELLSDTSYNTIANNIVTDSRDHGVVMGDSSNNNSISKNTITDSYWDGILSCYNTDNNEIFSNIIKDNGGEGIVFYSSSSNSIVGNIIEGNGYGISGAGNGIVLYDSNLNSISRNIVKGHPADGIHLHSSSGNVIFRNNVTDNIIIGILLTYSSNENYIIANTLEGNAQMQDRHNIRLDEQSSNNIIYHNNIISSYDKRAFDDRENGNSWNGTYLNTYGEIFGGNYWSCVIDWATEHGEIIDERSGPLQDQPGSDGIVDFSIETHHTALKWPAEDWYPLVEPYSTDITYVDKTNNQWPWIGTREHPYSCIQDAVDYALDGDTIYVCNGVYNENIVIDKSITLIGEDPETTIIDGGGVGDVIVVDADGVDIHGFTIRNGGSGLHDAGVEIRSDITIYENTITGNNRFGIYLIGSHSTTIYHNNFIGNSQHVFCDAHNYGQWDKDFPFGGNYWDDYLDLYPNAGEIDNSGIWDTPYTIGSNSQDNYPLMEPLQFAQLVYVDDDYDDSLPSTHLWFKHIQDGIDAVDEGGRVYVFNGIYDENIVVDKSINLIGENRDATIVDGSDWGEVCSVLADYVTIANFAFRNGDRGLYIHQEFVTVRDCNVYDNYWGIEIAGDSQNSIIGCNSYDNDAHGIWLCGSSENMIVNCDSYNNNGCGIYFEHYSTYYSTDNDIINCDFHDNGQHGVFFAGSSNNNSITNCVSYNNNGHGICLVDSLNNDIINCDFHHNSQHGIHLEAHSDNNSFVNCESSYNTRSSDYTGYGIYLKDSSNNSIMDCTFQYNDMHGMFLWYSSGNIILNCDSHHNDQCVTYAGYGIYLASSSGNYIVSCDSYNNEQGIYLYSSSNSNTIISCDFYSNAQYGLYLDQYSNSNNVTNCTFHHNSQHGIYLTYSRENRISGNTIRLNSGYGIYLTLGSSANLIYHNNFIDNDDGNAYDTGTNIWNGSNTGNYWSDFETNEGYPNGVYIIPGRSPPNQDNHPLMDLWPPDAIPPTLINDQSSSSGTTGDPLLFMVDAYDNRDLEHVYVHWKKAGDANWIQQEMTDGGFGMTFYYWVITVDESDDSDILYYFRAVDRSNNWAQMYSPTEPRSISITDDDPPSIDADLSPQTGTTGDSYGFEITASDNIHVNGVTVSWSHGTLGGTNVPLSYFDHEWILSITLDQSIEDMTYTITVRDTSENTYTGNTRTLPVRDNDPPSLDFDSSPDEGTTGDEYIFDIYASDNIDNIMRGAGRITVTWSHGSQGGTDVDLDPPGHLDIGWGLSITLDDYSVDDITYTITIWDSAGNTYKGDTQSVPVNDNDPPVTQCTINGNRITLSAEDNCAGVASTWLRILRANIVPIGTDEDEEIYPMNMQSIRDGAGGSDYEEFDPDWEPFDPPLELPHYPQIYRDWEEYNGTITVLDPGSYLVEYYSIDNNGYQETTKTRSFSVDPPIAYNQEGVSAQHGEWRYISLEAWDPDTPYNQLIFEIVDSPDHGVLNPTFLNPQHFVYYMPLATDPPYLGPDSFTFKVRNNDGDWSNVATVSISIGDNSGGS